MKLFTNCTEAEQHVAEHQRFSVCRLYTEEPNAPLRHTHSFCEIYYSISGGRHFYIGDRTYDAASGDLFVVAPEESHYLDVEESQPYERYVLFVHPALLRQFSTKESDLSSIFLQHSADFQHRLSLTPSQQNRLESLFRKVTSCTGFGGDLLEMAVIVEILVFLGGLYFQQATLEVMPAASQELLHRKGSPLAHSLIRYIDERITEPLPISQIAASFYISDSYACRIFKDEFGITINKYIQNRRLNIAKSLLAQGLTVTETCEKSGFNDYTNFIKLFTKTVGVSPKRYSVYGS